MIQQNSPERSRNKRNKRALGSAEEGDFSQMFSSSLSCLAKPSNFVANENFLMLNEEPKDGGKSPLKRIRMTSTDGFVSVKLPNGKLTAIEFKGKQIFAHQLHQLIEENTGFATGSTSMLNGGKILGMSDQIRSGVKISLLPIDFHRSGACISET